MLAGYTKTGNSSRICVGLTGVRPASRSSGVERLDGSGWDEEGANCVLGVGAWRCALPTVRASWAGRSSKGSSGPDDHKRRKETAMNVIAAPLSNDLLRRSSEVSQNRDVDTNRQSKFGGAALLDVHIHTESSRRELAARWRPAEKA
jgi:hypothetical protein